MEILGSRKKIYYHFRNSLSSMLFLQIFLFICAPLFWGFKWQKAQQPFVMSISVSVTYVLCWPSGILPKSICPIWTPTGEGPWYTEATTTIEKTIEEFASLLWIKWGLSCQNSITISGSNWFRHVRRTIYFTRQQQTLLISVGNGTFLLKIHRMLIAFLHPHTFLALVVVSPLKGSHVLGL